MRGTVRFSIILIVAVLVSILPFLIVGEMPGERWLSRADDNALLFAVTGSGLMALDIALPIPSSIVGTALGARLGFWVGSFWCWLGLMAGCMAGYGFGHLLPRRFAMILPEAPTEALLFLSRPVPVFAEAVTMAAGANRLPLRLFFTSCALGNAVVSAALCSNAVFWVPTEFKGAGLIFPMLLPVIAWFIWRRFGPQLSSRS